MSVELTHNNHRYMVENGQWFRRLDAGDRTTTDTQYKADAWGPSCFAAGHLLRKDTDYYRVPCTDPRPPFTVGQRVKVARKDESWSTSRNVGDLVEIASVLADGSCHVSWDEGGHSFAPPWCLDAVTGQTKESDR